MKFPTLSLAFVALLPLSAQAPSADDIIRVNSNLVQMDVVVIDNRG